MVWYSALLRLALRALRYAVLLRASPGWPSMATRSTRRVSPARAAFKSASCRL